MAEAAVVEAEAGAPVVETVPAAAAPEAVAPADVAIETKLELERTRTALKAANKESAERRKRLEQLEAAETARTQAEMTETDKLKAELAAAVAQAVKAEANAREMLIRSEFVAESAKAGVAHPEDVYLLADRTSVDIDEVGKVTGVAESVKDLVDAGRVPLAGRPQAPKLDGGAGSNERAAQQQVKLTPAEIEAARRMGIPIEKYAAQKSALAQE